ncbi:Protein kinase G11A [Hordeum vulgare]|nr:Protein kinase G11A [Hordeum vulgare]
MGRLCFLGSLAESTMVLAKEKLGKTLVVYAGIASVVAFMGPKRRRPPVFYFSLMMAADAEALATDSSLSVHPTFVSARMTRS